MPSVPANPLLVSATGTVKCLSEDSLGERRAHVLSAELGIRSPQVAEALRGAIGKAAVGRQGSLLSVPQSAGRAAAVIQVAPDDTGWAQVLQIPLDAPPQLPERTLLANLFGLTPMECDTAIDLLLHDDLQDIATERKVSIETVRMHVKSLLRKTGTPNQKKLLAMLTRLGNLQDQASAG